jgi:hypothetical protein
MFDPNESSQNIILKSSLPSSSTKLLSFLIKNYGNVQLALLSAGTTSINFCIHTVALPVNIKEKSVSYFLY